jgi:hypothetical protein
VELAEHGVAPFAKNAEEKAGVTREKRKANLEGCIAAERAPESSENGC